MPIYSYECTYCEEEFEANVAIANRDDPQSCPLCGFDAYTERRIVFTGLTWAPTAGGMR